MVDRRSLHAKLHSVRDPEQTLSLDGSAALLPGAVRRFRLTMVAGPKAGVSWESSSDRCSVGFHPSNDLVVEDPTVSRFHCEVRITDDGAHVRDLDSRNGTVLDGVRICEAWLRGGSLLKLGRVGLRFELSTESNRLPVSAGTSFGNLVGASVAMRTAFALLERTAQSEVTVLLEGETGTGKGVAAEAIHRASARKDGPFLVVDCGAIPPNLLESELFGHEKGAFTGAVARRVGAFEEASGGTIVLDEIGELAPDLQPKLLRVLESKEFRRVGGNGMQKTDVRVVAATNRDLRQMVNQSTFREDLYFRLSVIHVELPPLRERKEDIPALAEVFLREIGARRGLAMTFAPDAVATLQSHGWPGNVRELKNMVERAASLSEGPLVQRSDLMFNRDPGGARPLPPPSTGENGEIVLPEIVPGLDFKEAKQRVVDAFEAAYLKQLLERHDGNITRSSQEAGLTRYHLRELLKRHGLANVKD
jgi:DNA-binding NtrC family response regulator